MTVEQEIEYAELLRFQTELEFVQLLSNLEYVKFLAKQGYFGESSFINYIKYLTYWKNPEYAKFIEYPICLSVLDLIQDECFLDGLLFDFNLEKTNAVFTDMFNSWFGGSVAFELQKRDSDFLNSLILKQEDGL